MGIVDRRGCRLERIAKLNGSSRPEQQSDIMEGAVLAAAATGESRPPFLDVSFLRFHVAAKVTPHDLLFT